MRHFLLKILLLLTLQQAFAATAVVLPSTPALQNFSEKIQQGILAAYYADDTPFSQKPMLQFYTSSALPIAETIKQLEWSQTERIIGPLDKTQVESLIKAGPPNISILALNNSEFEVANIYQFSLNPEHEIARLVHWMQRSDIKSPLILSVNGDASSTRLQKIFQEEWQKLGGKFVPVKNINSQNLLAAITPLSQTGKHDAWFLASPSFAQQIMPSLTYINDKRPLYSVASAWDDSSVSTRNDLNGLHFCDLPWIVATTTDETFHHQINSSLGKISTTQARFFALGADAYDLSQNWAALAHEEVLDLRTGRLQAKGFRVHRTPMCAEVKNAEALVVWTSQSRTP